jgi:antitoxin CptB
MSDIETRWRKLKFRADRRGFRELDLYMQQFTDAHLALFDERQLDEFEAVLDIPDQHTFDWIMGRGEPAPEWELRRFRRKPPLAPRPGCNRARPAPGARPKGENGPQIRASS